MRRSFVLILLAYSAISCRAQDFELDTALNANERVHEFYMPYFGSEFQVDLNYQYRLKELADWLSKDTTIHLLVRGHVCCGDGQRLSRMRAFRVYRFLLSSGAPSDRISYKGYSNRCPKQWPEKTEEDEALNRRVDFVVRKL